MALLEVLYFPDPRLRKKAAPITVFDADLRRLVEDMYETMYENNGVGLAGTQVNVHKQIFTLDVSEKRDEPQCVINPEILSREGTIPDGEGCLSVPGSYDRVNRALKVRMRGVDLEGKPFEWEAEGLLAHVIQHETDHLDGKLFIDHLSRLKQERIRKKVEKFRK